MRPYAHDTVNTRKPHYGPIARHAPRRVTFLRNTTATGTSHRPRAPCSNITKSSLLSLLLRTTPSPTNYCMQTTSRKYKCMHAGQRWWQRTADTAAVRHRHARAMQRSLRLAVEPSHSTSACLTLQLFFIRCPPTLCHVLRGHARAMPNIIMPCRVCTSFCTTQTPCLHHASYAVPTSRQT